MFWRAGQRLETDRRSTIGRGNRGAGLEDPPHEHLGSQPATVSQTGLDSLAGERFKMVARFAEANTAQRHWSDRESATDEVIEGDATGHQVSARLGGSQRDLVFACQAFECLRLDERHLTVRTVLCRERPVLEEVAVAHQSAAG